MAIPALSPAGFKRVSRVMDQLGKAAQIGGDGRMQISDDDAKRLIEEFNKLGPNEKAHACVAMTSSFQDTFVISDRAQALFARAFGIDKAELSPRDRASIVGSAPTKSHFDMTVDRLAKALPVSKEEIAKLIAQLKKVDPQIQGFIATQLEQAQKTGAIKFDRPARKDVVKWMGDAEVHAATNEWKGKLDAPSNKNVDFLSSLMASGMCFEDMIMAFMAHIESGLRKEAADKMREMEDNDKLVGQRAKLEKKIRAGGGTHRDGAAQRIKGNQKDELANIFGVGKDTGPATSEPKAPSYDSQVKDLGAKLKTLVTTVDDQLHNVEADGSTGIINKAEARGIADKLDALPEHVSTLMAQSMINTLRHTEGVADKLADPNSSYAPIVEWAKKKLGDDIDLRPTKVTLLPGDKMTSELAKSLFQGDRLENKMAAFLVDTLMVSDKNMSDKIKSLDSFMQNLTKSGKAKEAFEALVGPVPTIRKESEVPNGQDHKTAAIPLGTEHYSVVDGTTLGENVADAVAKANETGKAVRLQFGAGEGVDALTVHPGMTTDDVMSDYAKHGTVKATDKVSAPPSFFSADELQQKLDAMPEPRSREMLFEELKNLNNLMSSMMQALGNILNSLHQTAMNSIRSIR